MGIESSNDKREWIKNNRLHLSANVGTNQWPAPPPSSQSESRFPWTRFLRAERTVSFFLAREPRRNEWERDRRRSKRGREKDTEYS